MMMGKPQCSFDLPGREERIANNKPIAQAQQRLLLF
jgi:hypothetical protein